jgi:hypothetical protein
MNYLELPSAHIHKRTRAQHNVPVTDKHTVLNFLALFACGRLGAIDTLS